MPRWLSNLFDGLALDPLLAWPWVWALIIFVFAGALLAGFGRLKSQFFRLVAGLFLLVALLNPQSVTETRQALPDTVIILRDESESMSLPQRLSARQEIESAIREQLGQQEALNIVTLPIAQDIDGTRLSAALGEALSNTPRDRLAGVIALTDGRVHDVSERTAALLPEGIPFHSLIIGDPDARDRRISAIRAPKFGVVGERADFELLVEDPGYEGERARIEVKLNGKPVARFPITIGKSVSIPLEIERRGSNTVEMSVAVVEGELTLNNNLFVSEISGVRDRLRVLLVTGEPHNGGRAWRNLLKSDPALDLVQFTILTQPRVKRPNAVENELSLIAFPTTQLFEEKLDEFDMIIFDQYTRRSIPSRGGRARPNIPPQYFANIARYVEDGGALLLSTGPTFATENSLYRTPLVSVIPTRPNGEIVTGTYRPALNAKGRRHPITRSFQGTTEEGWGNWYRIIDNDPIGGDVLMEGPDGIPLFVIDKIGDGRVAMLMSDQSWLWAKGHDGGGPYREMFRRTAHWLMGEPDLDADTLTARSEAGNLLIERRTLDNIASPVTVTYPDGTQARVTLERTSDGVFNGGLPLKGPGAYRLQDAGLSAITAIGALNPQEYAELLPTAELLSPVSEATGGGMFEMGLSTSALPTIRRLAPGRDMTARGGLGLVDHQAYTVTQSRRTPLGHPLIWFTLFFVFLAWGWRREGL